MKQHFLLPLMLLLATSFSLLAQGVPQGINYQCIVRNNQTGDPITNQTVTLLFSIRSGSPNGTVDYQEKHVGSTNEFGLVNLVIGRGQPQVNTFSAINWAAGSKFLTVLLENAPNVFDEIGNSELLSVPYALYAQNGGGGGGSDNWGAQTAFTNNGITGNGLANNPIGLASQGAQSGQVLKWNGTAWAPANDLQGTGTGGGTVTQINTGAGLQGGPITTTGTLSLTNTGVQVGTHGSATEIPVITVDAQGRITNVTKVIVQPGAVGINSGTGVNVVTNGFNNFTINNTGDTNASDDLTQTTAHDGDVSGPYNNLQLKANVVTSNELNNGAVTAPKLASMGAANGQVLKWNGSAWAPAADNSGNVALTSGAGINITGNAPNYTITNTGDTNAADDLSTSSQADGDVSGPFSNLQIKASAVTTAELAANAVTSAKISDGTIATADIANQAITGAKIDDMNAANGQVLKWDGTTWAPAADGGSVTINEGAGIDVTQNGGIYVVTNTGDTNPLDDLTDASPFNGDVTGTANNLQLKPAVVLNADMAPNSIGTNNLINGSVTAAKLNNMGAAMDQVLQYNGTAWVPVTLPGATGDNWGTQAAFVGNALTGNGTAATPLNLAAQNANVGEVLKWNGASWQPGADNSSGTGDSYVAGTGISVTGTAPNFVINNTGDADKDPANELQAITLAGNQLTLSKGGGTVTLPSNGNNYTEGVGINITGTAPNFVINNDGDLSVTNELQELSIAGNVLSISNGNSVNLPAVPNYTAGPGIQIVGTTIRNIGDLSATNEIQNLSLNGSLLQISNGTGVDLAPLLQAGGDDWNNIGTHIANANNGNVLIGTNVSTSGKLQVVNGDPANEAGRFVQNGGTQAAIFAQSSGGAGGFFTSESGPALVTDKGNVGIGAVIPMARLHVVGNGESIRLQGNTPSVTFMPTGAAAGVSGYARMFNGLLALGSSDASNVGLTPNGFNAVIANGTTGHVGIGAVNAGAAQLRVLQKEGGILLENQENGNFWEFSASPGDETLVLLNSALGDVAGVFDVDGAYMQMSDRRLKTDIEAISSGILDKIMQLEPKSYHYLADKTRTKRSLGFMAQDMQVLFPELVGHVTNPNTKKDYLNINYSGLGVLTVKAIQEQQLEIQTLKKENEALRNKTESLEARLLKLEGLIKE